MTNNAIREGMTIPIQVFNSHTIDPVLAEVRFLNIIKLINFIIETKSESLCPSAIKGNFSGIIIYELLSDMQWCGGHREQRILFCTQKLRLKGLRCKNPLPLPSQRAPRSPSPTVSNILIAIFGGLCLGSATLYTHKQGAAVSCCLIARGTLKSEVRWGSCLDRFFHRRAGGSGSLQRGVKLLLLLLLGRRWRLAQCGQRLRWEFCSRENAWNVRWVEGHSSWGRRALGPETVIEWQALKEYNIDRTMKRQWGRKKREDENHISLFIPTSKYNMSNFCCTNESTLWRHWPVLAHLWLRSEQTFVFYCSSWTRNN